MSKKIFTLLLLAVFVLAQFSIASAAQVAGTATLAASTFSNDTDVDIEWAVTEMDGLALQNVLVYVREKATPANPWLAAECFDILNVSGLLEAHGAVTLVYSAGFSAGLADQDTVELKIVVDDSMCAVATPPATTAPATTSAFVDAIDPVAIYQNPPTLDIVGAFDSHRVACNTFEMWALGSDNYAFPANLGYSGLASWKQRQNGTFVPPAPEGTAPALLSWVANFPSTASGAWTFSTDMRDAAFNYDGLVEFRDPLLLTTVSASERADCKDFSDTAGNANEVYVRYLADLGIGAGNPDGTYGPDSTLTRAEAAALFEAANGKTVLSLPAAPTAACSFSDVPATEWYAGWVWQACADGFLNGLGGGLFGPSDLLTRGQVVTILNNIATTPVAGALVNGAYFEDNGGAYQTVLNGLWGGLFPLRTAAFTDISLGAFYAVPVMQAYGWGVAEGTSDTTFSPDQAATRGEFAKMLYRALSRRD